jgi:hypothetical protein
VAHQLCRNVEMTNPLLEILAESLVRFLLVNIKGYFGKAERLMPSSYIKWAGSPIVLTATGKLEVYQSNCEVSINQYKYEKDKMNAAYCASITILQNC